MPAANHFLTNLHQEQIIMVRVYLGNFMSRPHKEERYPNAKLGYLSFALIVAVNVTFLILGMVAFAG